jgi:hypothetical protein
LSAKILPGDQTQILNVREIWRINRHPVGIEQDGTPESISGTNRCLNWDGDCDNSNLSEEICAAEDESEIEHNN